MMDLEQLIKGFRDVEWKALARSKQLKDQPTSKSLRRRADIAHLIASELERKGEVHPNSGVLELDSEDAVKIILDAVETICAERATRV